MLPKQLLFSFCLATTMALTACGDEPAKGDAGTEPQPAEAQTSSSPTQQQILAIFKDYELGTDSSAVSPVDDPNFEEYREYRKGVLKRKLIRSKDGRPLYEYLYGPGGWELRKIYCGNGQENFVGVAKNGEFYGLSRWWYCDGTPEHQGYRYNGKKFGVWYYYKEDGSLDYTEDFGMLEYMDSVKMAFSGL